MRYAGRWCLPQRKLFLCDCAVDCLLCGQCSVSVLYPPYLADRHAAGRYHHTGDIAAAISALLCMSRLSGGRLYAGAALSGPYCVYTNFYAAVLCTQPAVSDWPETVKEVAEGWKTAF